MSTLRTGLSEEDGYVDLVHVTADDVTETRQPSPEQARAIALLELNPTGLAVPRLSLAQWRHVDRVVRALGSLGVPAPRQAADDMETRAALAPLAGQHTTDQTPSAADSGALISDRSKRAARTVSPVVDHHSERTGSPTTDEEGR